MKHWGWVLFTAATSWCLQLTPVNTPASSVYTQYTVPPLRLDMRRRGAWLGGGAALLLLLLLVLLYTRQARRHRKITDYDVHGHHG